MCCALLLCWSAPALFTHACQPLLPSTAQDAERGSGNLVRPVGRIISKLGHGGESLLRRVNPLSLLPGHEHGRACVCACACVCLCMRARAGLACLQCALLLPACHVAAVHEIPSPGLCERALVCRVGCLALQQLDLDSYRQGLLAWC